MSGNISISEAPTSGLGKLIIENSFYVPTHQRDYRWDRDKVEKLFDDLIEAKDRGDRFYFIGLMVFMQGEKGLRVLDGQQRLATTIIILSAMRAWFGANEAGGITSNKIQYDFIGRAEYGEKEQQPKLRLNYNNNERFQRYVINSNPIPTIRGELASLSKHAPNYRLLDAISYCHQRVQTLAEHHADKAATYFADLLKYLRDSVVVVRLTVPNEANAFRVFETLNDRGLDLSAVDLLKNHLFGLADAESQAMLADLESRWVQIVQELQYVKEEEFLRVYWTSRNGRTQLEDIFEDVQKKFKTGVDAQNLSIDLLEASEQYAAIEIADDPVWSIHTPSTRELIASLKLLGSKQVRPVILSALKKFDVTEFERLMRLLEIVIVRWQIIGEQRTGLLEIQCARLAHLIWKGTTKTATEARAALDTVYLPDSTFQLRFSEKDGLSNQKAAYILKRIENHERSIKHGADARALSPTKELTVEHVMPKSLDGEWATAAASDPQLHNYTTRLGNLCLLTGSRNREAARTRFSDKKLIFVQCGLLTTAQIATYPDWNRTSIEQHQAWLASKASAVWRFQ